ncbi:MAG: hypothetical protein RLZZ435_888 [Cyanobacteriota bacterium]|jgi:hypothetical protein
MKKLQFPIESFSLSLEMDGDRPRKVWVPSHWDNLLQDKVLKEIEKLTGFKVSIAFVDFDDCDYWIWNLYSHV